MGIKGMGAVFQGGELWGSMDWVLGVNGTRLEVMWMGEGVGSLTAVSAWVIVSGRVDKVKVEGLRGGG